MTSSLDNSLIKIWRFNETTPFEVLSNHADAVMSLAFITFDKKTYLISGSIDCNVIVWNFERKSFIKALKGHDQEVTALGQIDDRLFASGSW